ncbi:unnamed protein product [Closterium sp. NIES-54]
MVADLPDNNPKSNGGAEKKERTAGQFFHIGEQGEQGDASAKVGAELHPLDYWVLDTGATWTMTPRKDLLDDVRAAPINKECSASRHALKVAGAGRAAFKGADGKPVVLHDVLLVPDLKANLISLRKLAKARVSTSMDGTCTYKGQLGNRVLWDLHESKDVYRSMWQLPALAWHGGGQAGEGSASQGECNAVGGVGVKVSARSGETDWAMAHRRLGHVAMPLLKQLEKDGGVKEAFGAGSHRLGGAAAGARAQGGAVFLTIVDDWSRLMWAYPLKQKDHAASTIQEDWLPLVEKQAECVVKQIRTDRGGEFLGAEMTAWLKKQGIQRELTTAYTPQSNGVAERANRTILKTARALLMESGVGNSMWPHAIRHATVARNRVLTKVGNESWVPLERWLGGKPPVDMLRMFGCMAVTHVPKKYRSKLGARAIWCVHLGLAAESKGWLLWEPSKGVLFDSRDVKFVEGMMYGGWKKQPETKVSQQMEQITMQLDLTPSVWEEGEEAAAEGGDGEKVQEAPARGGDDVETTGSTKEAAGSEGEEQQQGKTKLTAGADVAEQQLENEEALLILPHGYDPDEEDEPAYCFHALAPEEPASMEEALAGPDREKWLVSRDAEYQSLLENGTWDLVVLPEGKKAIQCKTSSCDESLFLKGEGEKLVLFLVYVDDILLFSSSMKEIQKMQQQLMKNIKCKTLGEVKYYLRMHVERDLDHRWLKLHQEKFIKELGEKYGIENERKVATPLPAEFNLVKAAEDEGVEAEEQQQFQSFVGSLLYAAVYTRPDISFSVGQLARVVQNPSEEQVDAAERVVKYLNSHPSIGVQYSTSAKVKQKGVEVLKEKGERLGEGKLFLTCFTDATWAYEKDDSSSIGGNICVVGGGPVGWRSKKQTETTLSSVESEYMAMFHGVKEVIWLRRLLEEIGQEQKVATPLFCDSKGALGMARNVVLHGLNKHMHIKWHWLRKEVKRGTVNPIYIKTHQQLADFLTKMLADEPHWRCVRMILIVPCVPLITPLSVIATGAPPVIIVIAALSRLPAFCRPTPLLLCCRCLRLLLCNVILLFLLQLLGQHGDFSAEKVDDTLVVNHLVDLVKHLHLTLVPQVSKDEVVFGVVDAGGDPAAMGEGMGSEEGDRGSGGHGGMFYHVGEACSEDMFVPVRQVSLHHSSHWVIDTGAFMTMTNQKDLLDEVRPSKAATVISATGQVVPVRGEGRAMFMIADGRLVELKRVLLVPRLCANLLSTKALSEAGMKMEMMGTKVFKATLDGRVLWDLRGGKDMHRSMWEILVLPWKEAAARLDDEVVRGGERVKRLRIKGEPKEVGSCETCLTSKFSQFPLHSAVGQSSDPVDLVHVDLVGPMKVKGDGGALYSMTMVDDYTRLTWPFPLAKKSDAARVIIEEWLPMVERESSKRVKAIRSDRGGDFLGAEFRSWLKQHGIKQQLTTAYTPQSNGVA